LHTVHAMLKDADYTSVSISDVSLALRPGRLAHADTLRRPVKPAFPDADTDISPTSSRGSSRECRRVVQLTSGITSGNCAYRTCRRGSSRCCPCRCRRRGMRAYTQSSFSTSNEVYETHHNRSKLIRAAASSRSIGVTVLSILLCRLSSARLNVTFCCSF